MALAQNPIPNRVGVRTDEFDYFVVPTRPKATPKERCDHGS